MGSYNSAVTTTAGQSLIARAVAGNLPCTLTSAKTTAYVVPGSTSLASLTSLPDIKQSEAITSASVVSNTQVSASVRFNNTDITLNYMINTIGVYAKAQGDSSETLLAVITAIDPDVMPSYSAASPVAYVYDITLSISNASSVNIVVAPTGSPNYSEFNLVKDEVTAARVGSDGVQYSTLEARLNAENTDLKSQLKQWTRLDDVVIKPGTNLYPSIMESGTGKGYYSNNGVITEVTGDNYSYFKIPVVGNTAYFVNDKYRWAFTVDVNGAVVDAVDSPGLSVVTRATAVVCCVTYRNDLHPITTFAQLAAASANAPTTYVLPDNVIPEDYADGNIFGDCALLASGKYVNIASGKLDTTDNANYESYILPVDGTSVYTFTHCRFAIPLAYDRLTALVTAALENVTQIDTSAYSNCTYIAFSFNRIAYPVADYIVSKGEVLTQESTYPDWTGGNLAKDIANAINWAYPVKSASAEATADMLASGENIIIAETMSETRKGDRTVFEADITSFSGLEIGLTANALNISDTNRHNVFTVDATNVSYKTLSSGGAVTVAHGLTIADNIQVILEHDNYNNLVFTMISDGVLFTHTFTQYVKPKKGCVYVASVGSALTNVKLTWINQDIRKKIWMFGDSYFGYSTSRWIYYLAEYGYDINALINAFSGEDGGEDIASLGTLLAYGTPKFAVWCAGMNDGSDTNVATPSAAWVTARDAFLRYCTINHITPIFATIPNVPNILHTGKNAWIKASGYRYIDFAAAVGASTAASTWYPGMLSSDNVHPTEQGAKALFARVLLDFPEIMLT